MPLKHFTETFLVVLLGAVIALTGLLTATLPALPEGGLPWTVLFVLSLVYPLSLHPLFQRRRADNFFRNLHWVPATMLCVWLVIQVVTHTGSLGSTLSDVYTWAWTGVPVLLGFFFIILFCLKVIRRRVPRLFFLALILIPFTAAAVISEKSDTAWESELADVLWSADFWDIQDSKILATLSGARVASNNLDPSEDPDEEGWREKLRMQERRRERIAARMDSGSDSSQWSSKSIRRMIIKDVAEDSEEPVMSKSVSSRPTRLTDSGLDWTTIISLLIVGYCGAVHARSRKRVA